MKRFVALVSGWLLSVPAAPARRSDFPPMRVIRAGRVLSQGAR